MNNWGYGCFLCVLYVELRQFIKSWKMQCPSFWEWKILSFMLPVLMPMAVLVEPLLGEDSAVISDELNHASIIDGVRMCKSETLSL